MEVVKVVEKEGKLRNSSKSDCCFLSVSGLLRSVDAEDCGRRDRSFWDRSVGEVPQTKLERDFLAKGLLGDGGICVVPSDLCLFLKSVVLEGSKAIVVVLTA